jgi:ornithine cyclodeaminase/alanine dehydrogenase-like protein (mu-crystallin family)
VALIGTGRIAGAVARAAAHVFDVRELRVTSRAKENRERFARHFSSELGIQIRPCESVRECVRGVDVVIAAVPSREPVIVSEDVYDVPQITLVGGDPRVVLADRELFTQRPVIVDSYEQALRTGDLLRAREEGWIDEVRWAKIDERPATLADMALRRYISSCGEMTTCVLTGIGALDLAVARLAWEQWIAMEHEPE